MFATAGTLHAEKENDTFADHRENILKTAKALVEDTKTLVAGMILKFEYNTILLISLLQHKMIYLHM